MSLPFRELDMEKSVVEVKRKKKLLLEEPPLTDEFFRIQKSKENEKEQKSNQNEKEFFIFYATLQDTLNTELPYLVQSTYSETIIVQRLALRNNTNFRNVYIEASK